MSTQHDRNQGIIDEFRANEGRVGGPFEGAPMVLMTTTGARSGQSHTTPLVPLVPILGILACFGLMATLPADTWIRLFVWLVIGFVIYFGYGRKHSVLQQERSRP